MDDKHLTFAPAGNRADKIAEKFVAVLFVNADAGFHRHRNGYHVAHRFDAIGYQLRIAHQARAEHAVLHAIGRATYVQVDLIITALLCQFRAMRKLRRITPPNCNATGCSSSLYAR